MKIAIFSPVLAPKRVFPFLTNLLSMASWTSFDFVCAEKLRKIVETFFRYFRSANKFPTRTDFPTPESPVKISGFSMSNICSMMLEYLIVSIVGTSRSKNSASLSNSNYGTFVDQFTNPCWVSGLTKWSKIQSALGKVTSEKQSSMMLEISSLWTKEIPPPKPQMKA